MKKLLSSLFVLVLFFNTVSAAAASGGVKEMSVSAAAESSFRDIPNNYWAQDEIDYLVDLDIINGYADKTFRPNDKLSRIQIALMVSRAKGYSQAGRPNPNLTDIKPGHKYYSVVATVMDEGLFSSVVKNNKFEPGKIVTRAEMASILAKAYNLSGISAKKFSDVPTSHWAYKFVQALAANDITYGITATTFGPNNEVNRVQFSAFLARALNDMFKENSRTNPTPIGYSWEIKVDDWLDGYRHYEIGIVEAITDGQQAWQMIQQANSFNEPAPAGKKYVLAKFYFKLYDAEKQPFQLSYVNIDAVSKNGVQYDHPYIVIPEPDLSTDVYKGGEFEGWAAFLVNATDEPVLVWNKGLQDELWFELKRELD